jgi:hypothetical protein
MSTTYRAGLVLGSAPPTSGIRRVGGALAMVLAPWGFVITNACYAYAIRNGGSDETGADALALAAATSPLLMRVLLTAGMIGCLLLVPAVLGAFRLAPTSRLVLIGGSLMIAGYVCYFAVLSGNSTILAMAARGGPIGDYAAVIDASQAEPWSAWVFGLFVLGNLVGTVVFAVGLLRSRAVPVWAALSILAWPPLHVIGLALFGNEVPQVIGALLQAAGFAGCAVALWRATSIGSIPRSQPA